ncbi:MAG: LacI family DNA-binding transcriptional regulator [Ilumatobacter sp.]|nr:LacI family DNA-binding transcriptional regulator [Ilumatobacter sp.]
MTETSHNLTLEEIGKLAGVSRSTVSRVINGQRHVRADVRDRVEAVIAETGYLPNQAARALVSNRTGLIGLVMPTDAEELFGDPYYSALVAGIQLGCADARLIFSIFPVDGQRDEMTVLSTLVAQGFVDGLIVTAGAGSDRLITALRDRGKNMVVVGHPADDRGLRRVDVENRAGSAAAVAHLVGLGRTRVGFVGPGASYLYGRERLEGYRDALVDAGRGLEDRLVRHAEPTVEGGFEAAHALLAEDPDSVHVATDTMAVGVLRAIAERGLRVPDDVAVVGFDGFPGAPRTEPSLTTVVQPVVDVGRTAVHQLHRDQDLAELVVLPTVLRIGATCGAIGGA